MVNNLQAMNIDSVLMNNEGQMVISSTPADIAEGRYVLVNADQNLTVQGTYDVPESNVIADNMGEAMGLMRWDVAKVNNKGAYKLGSMGYNKVMSLKARNKTPGTPVVTSNDNGLTSQMWVFCPVQSSTSQVYAVKNACSGLYLQLNCPGDPGSKLIQGNFTNNNLALFMLVPTEN